MENEKAADYQAVLADLKARRDQLNQTIALLEAMAGAPLAPGVIATPEPGTPGGNGAAPATEVVPGAFFGLTVLEAAKKYLGMVKKPQTASEITEAILRGGYLFSTSKPLDTVQALMNRDDLKGGEIVRPAKGLYGLAVWYPGRPRRKKPGEAAGESATPST